MAKCKLFSKSVSQNNSPFPPGSLLCGYIRDSGGDTQELSAKQQENYMRKWCQDNNLVLTRIYIDSSSGTTTRGRDEFHEMIRHFQTDAPEAGLIIWRHNRFARNVDDAQYYKSDLRRRGYIIHSLMDNIPQGTFMYVIETMEDTFAQQASEKLSEDVKRGLHDNFLDFGTLGGFPPKGFIRQPKQISTSRDGTPHMSSKWVPDPELLPIVKRAWQMRAAGATYGQIKKETNLFRSVNSFTTWFRNKLFIGTLVFGNTQIENYCDPVIDLQTWHAVQAQQNKYIPRKSQKHPRRANSSFLLSGLLLCGLCGSPLNGAVIQSKDGKTYRYYRCSRKNRNRDCTAQAIKRETLDTDILEQIQTHILDPKNLQHMQTIDAQVATQQRQQQNAQIKTLRAQHGPLKRKINHLIAAIAAAGHSQAMLAELKQLETQTNNIQAQITQLNNHTPAAPKNQLTPAQISQHLRSALNKANLEEKRIILHSFIETITVQRSGNTLTGEINYYPPAVQDKKKGPARALDDFYAYGSCRGGGTSHTHKF